MPIRAVILDWDGTVYDSSSLKIAGKRIIQVVEHHGYKIPNGIYKKLKDNWGRGGGKSVATCFNLDLEIAEKIYREWEEFDADHFYPLIQKPKQIIKKLRYCQIKILLLTNRHRKDLDRIMSHFGLASLFDFIQARDDWSFEKPDPHVFCYVLHQLAKLGIRPHECVYVGDTILDFECTTTRSLTSVSVLTGVFNKSDFLKAGQKKENIIRSVANLPEWIEKYGR